MRLSDAVMEKVKKAGITVYYADRKLASLWNKEDRDEGEPCFFCGWYWYREDNRQVVDTDDSGPFRSRSAAIRDAYHKLQLGRHRLT